MQNSRLYLPKKYRQNPKGRTYDSLSRVSSAQGRKPKYNRGHMAIYHLHTEPASRTNGKSAVAMAAYRCGGRLLDNRTGEVKDYSRKQGILDTAIFYPHGVKFDRQELWNLAEASEKRKDARIARKIRIALPHELEQEARFKLVNDFALGLVDRYGIAVDASIHDPDRQGDNRNYHAHLLLTTRQISQDGLGEKSDLERSDKALKLEGKNSTIQQIKEIRSQWEELCNTALERQGREERISAKSYRAREIDQQPTIHIGPAATAMERRGIQTRKVILNRAIRKQNQRRVLMRRLGRVRREIDQAEREISEIKQAIEKEQRQQLRQTVRKEESRPESREAMRQQEQESRAQTPKLSASDLLEKVSKSHMDERKLTVSDLLNRKQKGREKGLNHDERER